MRKRQCRHAHQLSTTNALESTLQFMLGGALGDISASECGASSRRTEDRLLATGVIST
jgi:hypothetical protein